MKNFKSSIRTKFILLFSILMALILALEFYFMNRTQQDVLKEFSNLSRKINSTTEQIIVRELDPLDEDSIEVMLEKQKDLEIKKERLLKSFEELEITHKKLKKLPPKFVQLKSLKDSLKVFDEIDIKVPDLSGFSDSIKFQTDIKIDKDGKHTVFAFNLPDFREPEEPRILRYKYSSASVEKSLQDVYWRNLLITALIFILSLIVIIFMTRRFLKPIEQLKSSFDNVVNGDLEVQVDNSATDEMGSLTRSFNLMVGELLKNKQKEKILQQKERLASLGQLAAGVAHEIKNPLNAINLTIAHLNDKYISKESEAAQKYIQTVQQEIQRLDKIVNNFLNYLRSEDLKKEQLEMNHLLDEVLHLYEREFSAANIEVQKDFAESFIVQADEERIKTTFVNIIVNAIQAMPKGGQLKIETDAQNREIRISDNGVGIAKKDLEHIFDVFYTTKQNGSGLGLPTAYKIIREHNADMYINSKEQKGTTVVIQWNEQ